jgi:hypothetical protein
VAQSESGRNADHPINIQVRKIEIVREAHMDTPRVEPGVEPPGGEHNEEMEEARRLRRLQTMMSLVMSVISQDPDLTVEEAAEMAANARRAALKMFPDKELAYDILYRPRLQRLMNERFRLQ